MDGMDILCEMLGLSDYQSHVLKSNPDKYDISRLVLRGGALHIPHATHGFAAGVMKILRGTRADIIGPDAFVAQNVRDREFSGRFAR